MANLTIYGIPKGKYFDLFVGEHPSEKIYCVQVKHWFNFFPDVPAAVNVPIPGNHKGGDNRLNDWVKMEIRDGEHVMNFNGRHLRVRPSKALVEFMEDRGIKLPKNIFVNPYAFRWLIAEPECVMDSWRNAN